MALYEQVYKDIFKKIKSHFYCPGDMLPSEKEMEEIYGVSRAPVRQALSMLSNNGLIDRKPGKGTFISKSEIYNSKVTLSGFSEYFSSEWNNIYCKTISVEKIEADKIIREKLGISEKEKVIKTVRVRFLEDTPIFYLEHFSQLVDEESIKEEGDFLAMRYLLIDKFNLDIEYVTEAITAVAADEDLANNLQVVKRHPLIRIDRTSYDKDYTPLEYVRYFVRSDYWEYNVVYDKKVIHNN